MTPPPLTPAQQLRIKFKTPAPFIIEALDNLEKGLAATIHQLCTSHVPLNDYLHRIKQTKKPICETCNTLETPSHYLIICKNFRAQRKNFLKQLWKKRLRVNPRSAISILDNPQCYPLLADFILSTA
ncbi:hypothetical protein O181_028501 [Austropuccinia psidii MF-1]|uniref:Reverse transcriptase zinc-binding domain-containing protein n=1 Tax=Austropuccinia psidii MF-1 TaxID=1389203 RepID=A0A9Q3H2F7_9BASI|nr:hypothetical protein [Austropuccinia psidii MF-1]